VEQEEEGSNTLRLLDVNSGETGPVASLNGSVVALWSVDGQALAFGATARPGSLLFTSIQILDLTTGQILSLRDESKQAHESTIGFFWSPRGDALFALSVDVRRSHLRWQRIVRESGQTSEIVRFLPSREQTLFFSFFDQYACSHPPIAPDGSALAFAGHHIGPVALDTNSPPQIYIAQLDQPGIVRSIGSGNFVCWGSK
jgi:Tol biopolymer transport system component